MANGQINAGPAARLMSVAVGRCRTRRSARVGRGAQSCTVPSDDGQNTASDLGTTSKLLPSTQPISLQQRHGLLDISSSPALGCLRSRKAAPLPTTRLSSNSSRFNLSVSGRSPDSCSRDRIGRWPKCEAKKGRCKRGCDASEGSNAVTGWLWDDL